MAICGDRNWLSGLLGVFSITGVLAHVIFCCENHALAQITPDGTLGDRSSKVTSNVNIKGSAADRIDGGTTRGANLFHSFREFNVGESQRVYFANPTGISNIFTRVTGSNISNILGTLGVDGGANLFFINPNGILFGNNARLDIRGSFVATTASSLKFADGKEFSAKVPQSTPLLTLSVPIGLQFGTNTRQIQVNGPGAENWDINNEENFTDKSIDSTVGLQVLPEKSLIFVGGKVSLDGGILQAPGGRVELGGLAEAGTVGLGLDSNNLQLSFPSGVARADILLTNASGINVVAENGGSIAVNARNLDVLEKSSLVAGIGSELGEVGSKAGDITLNATGVVKFERSQIINNVNYKSIGDGGNITIQAESVLFARSLLTSLTNGIGNAGGVRLKARDSVTLQDGTDILTFVGGDGVGNGGDVIIQAKSFSLIDGSGFISSSSGKGNSGNVIFDATDSVIFNGVDSNGFPSGVFTNTEHDAVGKSGDITIRTSSLSLRDGAQLVTNNLGGFKAKAGDITIETSGSVSLSGVDSVGVVSTISSQLSGIGSGGNITIRANSLSLQDGALLNSNTEGQGNAGKVQLEISGAVSLVGVDEDGNAGGVVSSVGSDATGLGGDINIQANSLSLSDGARLFASTLGQGDAGNITVNVHDAIAFDGINSNGSPSGAFTTVEPDALGNGGNINLTARSIRLDNQAAISAITASGNGGNVTLKDFNLLLLRRNSQISTSALTDGNGGNITINSPSGFIVAVPNEHSNITANAFNDKGGRVEINVTGIFGLKVLSREDLIKLSRKNDLTQLNLQQFPSSITAISQTKPDLDGQIILNTPDVDPSRGLIQRSSNLVDASQQIAQGCTPRGGQNASSFIATGRGGLPQSPNEPLRGRAVITGWVDLPAQVTHTLTDKLSTASMTKSADRIVEAQGWIVDAKGNVILVAQYPQSSSIPSVMSCSQ
ncbi:S-layer family protein [Nostoc sp. ChiVER01]|uniref:S-layer family protein n=1 Tax=Nostoc sp. ChiVER01 TaxID=3075382 RepID=UPI002AD4291D|nr:S-layer family protein [Nostoc sp. ChiVER01]MDZ8228165.1 S-layer family protein [Nostoc sp. ChiVER01]